MITKKSAWSRGQLLQTAAMGPVWNATSPATYAKSAPHKTTKTSRSIYDELGVLRAQIFSA